MGRVIYLDHNATTPLRPEVFEAMRPFLTERWGNPSSSYGFGSKLKAEIEATRRAVAKLVNASAGEVVFTGSATEADNTALNAALAAQPGKRHIITSAVEHSAVLNHCAFLEKQVFRVTRLPVDPDGLLSSRSTPRSPTTPCSCRSCGRITRPACFSPWPKSPPAAARAACLSTAMRCRRRANCPSTSRPGPSTISRSARTNSAVRRASVRSSAQGRALRSHDSRRPPRTRPTWRDRERRRTVGFGRAAELALAEAKDYAAQIAPLRDRLECGLLARIAGVERNGHPTERLANTTSLTFQGVEAEAMLLLLDQAGVCASAGSACFADSDEPSHVMRAMKPQSAAARQMIRFSLGLETTATEVETALLSVVAAV